MKKALLFLIASIFIHQYSITQTPWTYRECVSGVTTSLTSSSVTSFYPSQGMACGVSGVVLKTTNSGTNWINVSGGGLPANIDLKCIACISFDTAVTAGNIGSITYVYRTVNGGLNWTQVYSQSNGSINAISFKNTQLGYMVGNPVGGRWSLWKSTDKGLTWDSSGMYITQAGSETGFANSLAIRHNYILFGTNNSRIYRSTNSGENWSFMNAPEVNSTFLWVNWDTSSYPPGSGSGYIISAAQKLHYTTNIGNNWSRLICEDSTANFVGFCPGIPGVDFPPYYVFAAKTNGKIYFTGYGQGYTPMYTAPNGTYNHMSPDAGSYWSSPGFSFAVRTNGGITRVDYFLGGGIKQLSGLIPDAFELKQNYPNPFNPYTYIRFAVKKYGVVKLTVYNSAGEEVYEPVNELLKPGTYEVSWDASRFASGVYFYRMITDGFAQTNKMILVK